MSYKPILFNTEMVKAIQDGRKTQTRRIAKQICGIDPRVDGMPPEKFDFFISPSSNTLYWEDLNHQVTVDGKIVFAPFTPGDILWVRETWTKMPHYVYKADDEHPEFWDYDDRWYPSIHMPKEAARIFLHVKDVRIERLCQITPQDAVSEGISRLFDHMTKAEYEEWANRSGVQVPQHEQSWTNYLWHGHFGAHGMGNQLSNAWPWQASGYEYPRLSFSSLWNSTVQLKEWDKYGWDANPWVWVIEFERCERPVDFL